MKALIVTVLLVLFSSNSFSADTLISSAKTACWELKKAKEYAPRPGNKKIRSELGCKDFKITGSGATDCRKSCGSSNKYQCKGYVTAYCK